MLQEALDLQVELATLDVLDQMEWMHISGDSTNSVNMTGGQTDGLVKWVTASGYLVATGGTTSTANALTETFLKDGARGVAENYPTCMPDTLLVPPELIPDINGYVANGAGRPIVINQTAGPNGSGDLVAGAQVGYYNTGYSVLKIELEPSLSPLFNSTITNCACIAYNKKMVKNAALIKLGAEPIARTDTSVKKMVTTTWAQEHRVPGHTFIIANVKSAIS
jgi:hypothetical protein